VGAVRIERIDVGRHDWSDFGCGDPAVDGGLRQRAVAFDQNPGAAVYVATDGLRVVGCYRLASFQVQPRRPVRSPTVERMPLRAAMVSRLGVEHRWQGRSLGTWLMWHALELAAAVGPAVRARLVVAHGETEHAVRFVARFGFRAFDSDPRFGYLPMGDLQATISVAAVPQHSNTGKD
jgi:GNAT superfamily N-acetyltransferase